MTNRTIVRELRAIGERWNIPLLYQAADALDDLCTKYDQLWYDHSRLTALYAHQESKLMELERENIALKVKIDQFYRENQIAKRQSYLINGRREMR